MAKKGHIDIDMPEAPAAETQASEIGVDQPVETNTSETNTAPEAPETETQMQETGDNQHSETTPETPKVDPVFAKNPNLDVYYQTGDGVAFFTRNAAENHAKTLENKSIKKIVK